MMMMNWTEQASKQSYDVVPHVVTEDVYEVIYVRIRALTLVD